MLQAQHIKNIAWENLNVFFKQPLSLDYEKILNKYIIQKRGGLCYELNLTYYYLLISLGFKAKLVNARLYSFNKKILKEPRNTHIVVVVNIDGDWYLTDVAWNGFKNPLKLNSNVKPCPGNNRVKCIDENLFFLDTLVDDLWYKQYTFTLNSMDVDEIIPYLNFENAPVEQLEARNLMIIQYHENGFSTLFNNEFSFFNGKIKEDIQIENIDDLKNILLNNFGFDSGYVAEIFEMYKEKFEKLFYSQVEN